MKKKISGIIIIMLTLIVACCMVSCADNNNNTVIEPKNVIKVRGCESVDEIYYGMTYFDYFGKASFNTDKAKVHSGEGSLKLQPQGAVGWEYKDYAENIKKVRPFFTITGAMKSQPKWAFGDTGNYVTSIDGYFYNDTDANVPLYVYVTYQTDKGNITRNLKTAGETSELTGNKDVNIESLASKQWQKISYNTMPDVSKLINAGYAVSGVATVSYMFNPVEDDAAVPTIYVDDFALNISRAPTISVGKTPASIFVGDEVILDITSTTKDATLETKVTLNDKPIIVTDNKFISEAAGESYKVTVKATSKENESISIVRNIKTNGKFHGVIDFDDKVAPVGFTPVPISGTECNAKVTYSKDFGYESSYSLKMNAGNVSGVSNVLEITNTEFIENIKTFDYFTFMMISNNPYPGEIKIDSPDTPLGFDGTYQSVVEWTQFKIPTSAFYSIYGENFTKVRIYIAAVDATATSWYAYLDDFRFGFDEETSVIVSSSNYVGIKGDYTTTIQLKKTV